MSRQKFHEEDEEFAKWCPKTWQIISGRRYLVPDYRARDYANQLELITRFRDYFEHLLGGTLNDDNFGVHFENLAKALAHRRPTYFLERELGEAFCRTQLPPVLEPALIKWKFPQIRVLLPLGLLALEGEKIQGHPGPFSYSYLDIVRMDKGSVVRLPKDVALELEAAGAYERIQLPGWQKLKGALDSYVLRSPCDSIGVCSMCSVAEGSYFRAIYNSDQNLTDINQAMDLKGSYTGEDQQWFRKAQHLALNILLFMSSSPPEIQPPEELRKPSVVGDRFVSGLYKAHFIGDAQRQSLKNEPEVIAEKMPKETSGSAHAAHWVCGHWHTFAIGKGRIQRRLQWVQPYRTGKDEQAT